jgi:hypothetical protein
MAAPGRPNHGQASPISTAVASEPLCQTAWRQRGQVWSFREPLLNGTPLHATTRPLPAEMAAITVRLRNPAFRSWQAILDTRGCITAAQRRADILKLEEPLDTRSNRVRTIDLRGCGWAANTRRHLYVA